MFKRRRKLFGKIFIGLVGMLIAFLSFERFRGQIALTNSHKALRQMGEKLSPTDFVRGFDQQDNGAPVAMAGIERLQRGTVLPHPYPPRMKVMPSGRAVVCFRESEWIETGTFRSGDWVKETVTNDWKQVAFDLQTNAATLAEIRAALEKPVLNNQLDWSDYPTMELTHLSRPKALTTWFGAATQLALHEGRNHEAAAYLVSQISVPKLLAEDHTLIAELVRIAISGIAWADTWEALQADGWADEDLLMLQRAWEVQRFVPAMAHSFEGERVIYELSHEAMRASNQTCYDVLFRWAQLPTDTFDLETHTWVTPPLTLTQRFVRGWRKNVHSPIWRFAWSHQAQQHGVIAIHDLTQIGRTAATNASKRAVEQAINQWTNKYYCAGLYSRLRLLDHGITTMSKALSKAMGAETERSLVIAAIALKRYHTRNGDYPTSLNALVPDFLSTVPLDFMDGTPVKYRRESDRSFLLYSVGEDGRDDNGDASPPTGSMSRSLRVRRDYVWPAPATPEEVDAYRREALQN